MKFEEFINRLYKKQYWYDSNNNKITKGNFTKALFLNSVTNERIITDSRSSIEVFKGYNKGNNIAKIAKDTLNNLNEKKLQNFFENSLKYLPGEEYRKDVVNNICSNFKDVIDNITPENMCGKIADYFINEVLKPASEDAPDTHLSTTSSHDPPPISSTYNVIEQADEKQEENEEFKLIEKLIKSINGLFELTSNFYDKKIINTLPIKETLMEEYLNSKEYTQAYNEFKDLKREFLRIQKDNDYIKEIKELLKTIEKRSFICMTDVNAMIISDCYNYYALELRHKLSEAIKKMTSNE